MTLSVYKVDTSGQPSQDPKNPEIKWIEQILFKF